MTGHCDPKLEAAVNAAAESIRENDASDAGRAARAYYAWHRARVLWEKSGLYLELEELTGAARERVRGARLSAANAILDFEQDRLFEGADALAFGENQLMLGLLEALLPDAERGSAIKGSAAEGGMIRAHARRIENESRDKALAREFLERRGSSNQSDTALKADIGKKVGLSRSAAVDAINRGLKKVSG